MKKVLMIITLVSVFSQAQSQWSGTTGNINYSGGNIGIGNPGPIYYRLDLLDQNVNESGIRSTTTFGGASSYSLVAYSPSYATVPAYANKTVLQTLDNPIAFSAFGTNSNNQIQFYTGGRTDAYKRMVLDQNGNLGIGTSSPNGKLHIVGSGGAVNAGDNLPVSGDFIVQANTGGRSTTSGAQLEFVIPANGDGSNMWGQGRILTVAGNTNSGNASGKMILGTRRYFQKPGTSSNQWYYGDDLIIDSNGSVGIGAANLGNSKLSVEDGMNTKSTPLVIRGNYNAGTNGLHHTFLTYSATGAISNNATTETSGEYSKNWHVGIASNGQYFNSSYYVIYSKGANRFMIDDVGNVGIGTTAPDAKLTVNGTVHAKEVKVGINIPAPDYVFEENYNLPSLTEIENYIKQNKHLPEVPAAKEMEANGINLSEMNMLLLKKVEELTLHLIDSKKEIEALRSGNEQLKKRMDRIEKINEGN